MRKIKKRKASHAEPSNLGVKQEEIFSHKKQKMPK
jgi:hypothetical protein